MTHKQKKYVKALASGKSVTDAARAANYSESVIKVTPAQPLKSKEVQTALQIALEKSNITDDRLMKVLDEGLDATKVISALIINGKSKDADEKTNDFVEVPDWANRHKFLETGLELRGHLPANEPTVQVGVNCVVVLPPQTAGESGSIQ